MKRSRAFTMIELMVVLFIISVMVAFFLPGLIHREDDAKFSRTEVQVAKTIPSAVHAWLSTGPDFSHPPSGTVNNVLESYGAPAETAFGTHIIYRVNHDHTPHASSGSEREVLVIFSVPDRVAGTPQYQAFVNFVTDPKNVGGLADGRSEDGSQVYLYYHTE